MNAQAWLTLAGMVLTAIVTATSQRIHARFKAIEDELSAIKHEKYFVRLELMEDRLGMSKPRKWGAH